MVLLFSQVLGIVSLQYYFKITSFFRDSPEYSALSLFYFCIKSVLICFSQSPQRTHPEYSGLLNLLVALRSWRLLYNSLQEKNIFSPSRKGSQERKVNKKNYLCGLCSLCAFARKKCAFYITPKLSILKLVFITTGGLCEKYF